MSLFTRLMGSGSLRPEKRSSALISIAQSLSVIASGIKVIVLREYGADLDQPSTRADREREVFDPIYPDNEREAISEEVERIRALEAEWQHGAGHGARPETSGVRVRKLGALTTASAARGEELTPEEREFLSELGAGEEI